MPGSTRVERPRRWRTALALALLLAAVWWLAREFGQRPSDSGPPLAPSDEPVETLDEPSPTSPPEPATGSESRSEPVLLRGSCLDAATAAPLEGFTIVVDRGAASARTDGGGRFSVLWTAEPATVVEVLPRAGWSEGLPARELSAAEASGAGEIVLRVPTHPRAPVRGRVFDRRTGSPLDRLRVVLGEGSERTELATDAAGEFASEAGLPLGPLRVEVIDDAPEGPAALAEFFFEHTGDSVDSGPEIPVRIGPTTRLAVEGTVGEVDPSWRARIVERRGDPSLAGRLVRSPWGWTLEPRLLAAEVEPWSWTNVREGDAPWIRYSELEREPDEAFDAELEVESGDGRLRGTAPLPATVGVLEQPVAIRVQPVGTLVGEVALPDSGSAQSIRLWLEQPDTGSLEGPWIPEPEGGFEIRGVTTGLRRLVVTGPGLLDLVRDVTVDAGENRLGALEPGPAAAAHHLMGTLVCRKGHRVGSALVELEGEVTRDRRSQLLRDIRPGALDALASSDQNRFTFSELPGPRYTVRVLSITGRHSWSPEEVSVTLPAPRLEFECTDGRPPVDVQVRAVDAETGAPVTGQEFHLGPVRLPPFSWPESRPVERWFSLPGDSSLGWTVSAPGYRPSSGSVGELTEGAPRRPARVELERGFGLRLELRTGPESGGASVEGVEARVDGRVVGRSDAAGELLLQLPAEPERMDLVHPRWSAYSVQSVSESESRLLQLRILLRPR